MSPTPPLPADRRLVRLHTAILLASWLAGTALGLAANVRAPTMPAGPVTDDTVSLLHANCAWYVSGYALFFVSDCAIALLGTPLFATVWLIWMLREMERRVVP